MKYYVFMNKEGNYYAGHSGKFLKDLKDARFFKSEKTALRWLFTENYNDLELCEVEITPIKSRKVFDVDFEKVDNANHRAWKRKNKEN